MSDFDLKLYVNHKIPLESVFSIIIPDIDAVKDAEDIIEKNRISYIKIPEYSIDYDLINGIAVISLKLSSFGKIICAAMGKISKNCFFFEFERNYNIRLFFIKFLRNKIEVDDFLIKIKKLFEDNGFHIVIL